MRIKIEVAESPMERQRLSAVDWDAVIKNDLTRACVDKLKDIPALFSKHHREDNLIIHKMDIIVLSPENVVNLMRLADNNQLPNEIRYFLRTVLTEMV
jgi:hypothetical protein